ncbi:kinase-like domain-containing protein, partial [Powellomyces hirtus]
MTGNFPQVPTPAPRGVRVSQFFGSNGSPPPPHHPPPQQPLPPQPSSLSTSTTGEPNSPTTPPVTPFKWELGKLIGQGAFGKVFIGLNFDTGELMAVKQVERHILADPTKKSSNDPARKKREDALRREIDFLKDLEHPHIVRCLGSEILETTFNVFLEYISGGSVSSCLNRYGAFEEHIVKCMTAQILCGLEFLHEKSIIHRDIKGANILVDAEGIVKISDFGISKKNEYREAYHRVTRMSMQGSIPWMAPEVARGKGYSAKVDIWSLGCLVLEMLTSQTPWHKARGNVIYLLGTGNAPPLPGTLTPASRSFIEQCFKIDPELRPTATDLL